ncbi:MAG: DUF2171 domain-containing protein [Rhizonema sp. NSF051]|nr:DUF2171 domain-containing protein [Rhizonema sp. NSF051]
MDISKIKKNLTVHTKGEKNKPGEPIGTVEHIDSDKYIKLTQNNSPDGLHHWIPLDWIESVDDQAVYLNKTQEQIITGLMVYHCNPSVN